MSPAEDQCDRSHPIVFDSPNDLARDSILVEGLEEHKIIGK
jgi:hypothetical protein